MRIQILVHIYIKIIARDVKKEKIEGVVHIDKRKKELVKSNTEYREEGNAVIINIIIINMKLDAKKSSDAAHVNVSLSLV